MNKFRQRTAASLGALLILALPSWTQGSDNCATATPISGVGTQNFNSSGATSSGPSACGGIGRDIWFAWTATSTQPHTFETCTGTFFDSVLVAYAGTSCPPGAQLACNDDACDTQSRISFDATSGQTYLIRIGSFNGGPGGNGTLTITAGGPEGCPTPAVGADVIVGDLPNANSYNGNNGTSAFSIATTSCNVGTQELNWISSTNKHPVIAQNMYRRENGRFEQVGQSWLKHGFFALQQDLCCECSPGPGNGSALGIGCSVPYSASLNGGQGGLGPRFEVNAHSGVFAYPFTDQAQSGNSIYKRLQVANTDLDPALHPSAVYYGEGHYIASDDAAAGNGNNNASYRRMTVDGFSGGGYDMSMAGMTMREDPAIAAWQAAEPSVQLEYVQVPDEGLFIVGSKATDNGDGTWHYEYAVHNLNSDASGGSFSVPLPSSATVTNIGFHDVDYHSGEPFSGADWTSTRSGNSVTWATETFASNPNANALRWSTLYNFRFDADVPPATGFATLGLFKPHSPNEVLAPVTTPECTPLASAELTRLGSPANPNVLMAGQTSGPIVGATWDPLIDHTSFLPGAVTDFIMANPDGVQANVPSSIGTILCNIPDVSLIFVNTTPGTPFSIPVPSKCDLVGLTVCSQGGSLSATETQLTNALDLTIGSL